MSISNYLELELLDHVLGGASYSSPATVYISLHTADPGEAGADEVTGGSYARQACAFDVAAAGATANTAQEDFTGMPAATVTHVGIWDASTTGNYLWGGALSASKTPGAGDTVTINAGDLDVTLD